MSASSSDASNAASKEAAGPSSSKRRWTQEEKQQRKAQRASNEGQQQPKPKREKKLKSVLSFPERLVECAKKAAASTNRVYVKPGDDSSAVRVSTTSNSILPSIDQEQSSSTIIIVKPLLILDLNGILCYRIRHGRDLYPSVPFRKSADYIANTPIIPRVQVDAFLQYLDAHFCLAVWTSAKPKTAKLLLKLLFPESIRLLFVWTQHQCQSIPNPEGGNKPIFVKSLEKVWKQYPLWNETNTLLVDDSPEKCPDVSNTLHPPPLNGKQQQQQAIIISSDSSSIATAIPPFLLSDEENEAHQLQFFSLAARQHFWVARETWPAQERNALSDFLNRTAVSHMGWRGATA